MDRCRNSIMAFVLVTACLAQCGCLLALAGAGAGAGAYAYHKGQSKGCFRGDFASTWHATRASLHALGLPITDERYGGLRGTIEARTGDHRRVVVKMRSFAAPIPNDGFRTEVAVRVGTWGDSAVSDRILTEIGLRLNPPGFEVPAVPAAAALPSQGAAVEHLPALPAPVAPPPPVHPQPYDPNSDQE